MPGQSFQNNKKYLMKSRLLLVALFFLPFLSRAQNTFPTSGNVGIGTTTPSTQLEAEGGNIRLSNSMAYPYGINIDMSALTPWAREFSFTYGATGKLFAFGVYSPGGDSLYYGYINGNTSNSISHANPWMAFRPNGNIGIGTSDPGNYKLAVNGSAIFTRAKVEAYANWPDYVFEPDYPLLSLDALDQYIKLNKHLPGIPAASQVEKEGLDIGDMSAALVKQVEELSLRLIEMDKRNQKQDARIRLLEQKHIAHHRKN
jgi:hypothetical protein